MELKSHTGAGEGPKPQETGLIEGAPETKGRSQEKPEANLKQPYPDDTDSEEVGCEARCLPTNRKPKSPN